MFDLEKSIAKWRQQMLAAGIQSPATLDELEGHLREEIERRLKSGMGEQQVFEMTVSQIGQGAELKTEFAKAGGWLFWLGSDAFTKINRILGTLWLAFCSFAFVMVWRAVFQHVSRWGWESMGVLIALLLLATYGVGVWGSILLICGIRLGRWIVGIIAALYALISLFVLLNLIPTVEPFSIMKVGVFTAFYAITAWLMFLPSYSNVKTARK